MPYLFVLFAPFSRFRRAALLLGVFSLASLQICLLPVSGRHGLMTSFVAGMAFLDAVCLFVAGGIHLVFPAAGARLLKPVLWSISALVAVSAFLDSAVGTGVDASLFPRGAPPGLPKHCVPQTPTAMWGLHVLLAPAFLVLLDRPSGRESGKL
jgi:hypothetical protein